MRQLYKIDALTGQASLVAGFQDNWVPLTMQFSGRKDRMDLIKQWRHLADQHH